MNKSRLFRLILMLIWAAGCSKPDLYLPVNDNPGQSGINDLSQVLIFFKTEGTDTLADLHAGQIITSTHWVVHIDRRLPMKTLVTPLQYLLKKRHKKSIHSKPGSKLYLSYTDTVRKRLSVVDFTRRRIRSPFYHSREYVRRYPARYRGKKITHAVLLPSALWLDSLRFAFPAEKQRAAAYLKRLLTQGDSPRLLMFNVDHRVNYGRFNDAYGLLMSIDSIRFPLAEDIFIFNPQETRP